VRGRAFSLREKVAEGRMRDLEALKIYMRDPQGLRLPHPAFGHPPPEGEGPHRKFA
jgi:hypothetical protein